MIFGADGFFNFFLYHADRGLQAESVYSTFLLVAMILGKTQVTGVFSFGSWNITSPLADTLAKVSPFVTIGLLLMIYAFFAYRFWKNGNTDTRTDNYISNSKIDLIIRYSLLTVLVFFLSNKVLSPQFLIWLCPLIPLVRTRWRYAFWSIFIIACGLTQYVFPYNYLNFETWHVLEVSLMAARNFLLIVMAVWLILPYTEPSHRTGFRERIIS